MGVTLRQCDRTEAEVLMVIAGSFEPHNGVVLSSNWVHPRSSSQPWSSSIDVWVCVCWDRAFVWMKPFLLELRVKWVVQCCVGLGKTWCKWKTSSMMLSSSQGRLYLYWDLKAAGLCIQIWKASLSKQMLELKVTVLEDVVPLPVSGEQLDASHKELTQELSYNLQSRIEVSFLDDVPMNSSRLPWTKWSYIFSPESKSLKRFLRLIFYCLRMSYICTMYFHHIHLCSCSFSSFPFHLPL